MSYANNGLSFYATGRLSSHPLPTPLRSGMSSAFNEHVLADKLSKLNSTQQCIETLSHWCIFHRSKAEHVVQTWEKQFHSSQKEQKVPFLYLANDIIQNSRRKGTEFVGEFWKVLPAALKVVMENSDEHGKNAVSRLINIWEERRVFGSRAHGLKDLMLGKEPPPPLELNKKRSRAVRIVKRDPQSIRVKLGIGGIVERIVSAFCSVHNEQCNEDSELTKCKAAIRRVGKMQKDIDSASNQESDPRRETLAERLQEEENLLTECIEKLKSVEDNRALLVDQLKEALREQESELENVRTQLQVAQAQAEESRNNRIRLNNAPNSEAASNENQRVAEESHRKKAKAIADRLAASTSSFQMMASVLSTFAAEESKNAGLTASSGSNPTLDPEKTTPAPNATAFLPSPLMQSQIVQPPLVLGSQLAQHATSQPQYQLLPILPPPQLPPAQPYSSLPPPPPPPLPQHPMNLARVRPPSQVQQGAQPGYRTLLPPTPSTQFFNYNSHG